MSQFSDACSAERVRLKFIMEMKKGISFYGPDYGLELTPLKLIFG